MVFLLAQKKKGSQLVLCVHVARGVRWHTTMAASEGLNRVRFRKVDITLAIGSVDRG